MEFSTSVSNEQEYELTYLAAEIPEYIQAHPPVRLTDIYIPEDSSIRSTLRLRQKGQSYEITKKIPLVEGDSSAHTEYTIPLSEKEFLEIASISMRRVVKDRYTLPIEGSTAEVDIFKGPLEGLVLIDFEFESEQVKESFTPPVACLADITQERFIGGGELAGKSYGDIEEHLSRFSYKALYLDFKRDLKGK